ncbi:methyltransferase domain-containing protein [Streptomyces sp. TRM64462]|uniref:methyltransferase domain-containing protein n=1 Tax=Streptomyces sp. TRM64462 TaxID=2741726 RepID=UPI0028159953|nr:methyltransferase domain-containing protein [Streptomyces sp. TRM64462]
MAEEAKAEVGPDGLASRLMESGALAPEWLPAFEAVPRDQFVPDVIWPGRSGMNRQDDRVIRSEEPELWWRAVYTDAPITTQWDDGAYTGPGKGRAPSCSNSMPTMVFSMLSALDVQPGHRVLEIGTGTGWNAALLSHRLGDRNVVTIEVDDAVAEAARGRLSSAGFKPTVVVGDGTRGYGKAAPYDRIIATCSVGQIPSQWIGQAHPGAVVVAPWGPVYGGEAVTRLVIDEDGLAQGHFIGSSAFMRLRQQRKNLPPTRRFLDKERWPLGATRSTTTLSPDDVGDWICMFAIGVQVQDLFCRVDWGKQGAYRLWLFDTGVTSWASADFVEGRTEFEIAQAGPRRLWNELEAAYTWWDDQGQPGFARFGLTTRGGPTHEVWLDTPGNPVPRQAATSTDRHGQRNLRQEVHW